MKAICLLTLALSAFVSSAYAGFGPLVTTDQLTCQQAIAYVEKYKMYWKQKEHDGAIPIYGINPLSVAPYCKANRDLPDSHYVRTRDSGACRVAWVCRNWH